MDPNDECVVNMTAVYNARRASDTHARHARQTRQTRRRPHGTAATQRGTAQQQHSVARRSSTACSVTAQSSPRHDAATHCATHAATHCATTPRTQRAQAPPRGRMVAERSDGDKDRETEKERTER
eukprot:1879947-Prymnesium_polylepis.1